MTTAIKLSQPQITALYEIHAKVAQSLITARKNTVTSLLNAKLIQEGEWAGEPSYRLTDEGFRAIGEPVVDREANALIQEHDSIEDELVGDPWDADEVKRVAASQGIILTDQEAQQVASEEMQVDVYRSYWADWERELGGFEATIGWNNTQVWDGLTATEIREDMDTAKHVSRKDRRKFDRVTAKLVKKGVLM